MTRMTRTLCAGRVLLLAFAITATPFLTSAGAAPLVGGVVSSGTSWAAAQSPSEFTAELSVAIGWRERRLAQPPARLAENILTYVKTNQNNFQAVETALATVRGQRLNTQETVVFPGSGLVAILQPGGV